MIMETTLSTIIKFDSRQNFHINWLTEGSGWQQECSTVAVKNKAAKIQSEREPSVLIIIGK